MVKKGGRETRGGKNKSEAQKRGKEGKGGKINHWWVVKLRSDGTILQVRPEKFRVPPEISWNGIKSPIREVFSPYEVIHPKLCRDPKLL